MTKREVNEGAYGNVGIYERVKKGDILLIPQLPDWGKVTIAEATEDFDAGYKFEIVKEYGDYGHVFPAKYIKSFVRNSQLVTGDLRKTLKFRRRFKWIYYNNHAAEIEDLLKEPEEKLQQSQSYEDRALSSIGKVFNEIFDNKKFSEHISKEFHTQFNAAEWERALVAGLEKKFPHYTIARTGGSGENIHGTDILITMLGIIPDYDYAIAIQVKDYDWIVGKGVIEQIKKAEYWDTKDNIKLIDKIVIITKAKQDANYHLIGIEQKRQDRDVKFIFARELEDLLADIAKSILGIQEPS